MSQALIDGIYSTLKQDESFMSYFGLTPTSPADIASTRLIKGVEPDQAITSKNIPQILIYVKPGRYGRNHLVFKGKFCLEIYGQNSVQARNIANSAFELLHDEKISHDSFQSFRCHLAYDADMATGITGVKGYTAIYDVDYVRG